MAAVSPRVAESPRNIRLNRTFKRVPIGGPSKRVHRMEIIEPLAAWKQSESEEYLSPRSSLAQKEFAGKLPTLVKNQMSRSIGRPIQSVFQPKRHLHYFMNVGKLDSDTVSIIMEDWIQQYNAEKKAYFSVLLFCEAKFYELTEVCTGIAGQHVRTAVCFDMLDSIISSIQNFRLQSLFVFLRNELAKAVYVTYTPAIALTLDALGWDGDRRSRNPIRAPDVALTLIKHREWHSLIEGSRKSCADLIQSINATMLPSREYKLGVIHRHLSHRLIQAWTTTLLCNLFTEWKLVVIARKENRALSKHKHIKVVSWCLKRKLVVEQRFNFQIWANRTLPSRIKKIMVLVPEVQAKIRSTNTLIKLSEAQWKHSSSYLANVFDELRETKMSAAKHEAELHHALQDLQSIREYVADCKQLCLSLDPLLALTRTLVRDMFRTRLSQPLLDLGILNKFRESFVNLDPSLTPTEQLLLAYVNRVIAETSQTDPCVPVQSWSEMMEKHHLQLLDILQSSLQPNGDRRKPYSLMLLRATNWPSVVPAVVACLTDEDAAYGGRLLMSPGERVSENEMAAVERLAELEPGQRGQPEEFDEFQAVLTEKAAKVMDAVLLHEGRAAARQDTQSESLFFETLVHAAESNRAKPSGTHVRLDFSRLLDLTGPDYKDGAKRKLEAMLTFNVITLDRIFRERAKGGKLMGRADFMNLALDCDLKLPSPALLDVVWTRSASIQQNWSDQPLLKVLAQQFEDEAQASVAQDNAAGVEPATENSESADPVDSNDISALEGADAEPKPESTPQEDAGEDEGEESRGLFFDSFVEAILRIAVLKFWKESKGVRHSVDLFIRETLLSLHNDKDTGKFSGFLRQPAVEMTLKSYLHFLKRLFRIYAFKHPTRVPLVSYADMISCARFYEVLPKALSLVEAISLLHCVGRSDTSLPSSRLRTLMLNFTQFQEFLCCMSCYIVRQPFSPMEARVATFVTSIKSRGLPMPH